MRIHRFFIFVFWLVVIFFPAANPIEACSCIGQDYGFLTPSGAEIPSNARGVAWKGSVPYTADYELDPDPSKFRVEMQSDVGWIDVPFDVIVLDEDLGSERMKSHDFLILIAPQGGLVLGARYRFVNDLEGRLARIEERFLERLSEEIDAEEEAEIFRARQTRQEHVRKRYAIEVDVSVESFEPTGAEVSLKITKRGQDTLAIARGASCGGLARADQVELELNLPPSMERWREAFLFTTFQVGGEIWRGRASTCSSDVPGRSWIGSGRELYYQFCSWKDGRHDLRLSAPKARTQTLAMTAWLPGTDLAVSAKRMILTDCRPKPPQRKSFQELAEPIYGAAPYRVLENLEVKPVDGTSYWITRYVDDSKYSERLLLWKEVEEGTFERIQSIDGGPLEWNSRSVGEHRLLIVSRESNHNEGYSNVLAYRLADDAPMPIELDRRGKCGEHLPEFRMDHFFLNGDYRLAENEVYFQKPILGDSGNSKLYGVAEFAEVGEGVVLRALDCRYDREF